MLINTQPEVGGWTLDRLRARITMVTCPRCRFIGARTREQEEVMSNHHELCISAHPDGRSDLRYLHPAFGVIG
jgi:hypothetical protein